MRRKFRRGKNKNSKILIIGSLSLLLFLCVGYAAFSTNLSITAKGNIKEQTRVIQSWGKISNEDFHTDFYRENIVSATFLDNNNIPSNATESWNVSQDKENGGVMAWVIPNSSDNTKYDLYIGAKGGVIANEDSSNLFKEFRNVVSIDFNKNFDTRNAITMESMFLRCNSLINLDVSSFNTSNVTNMHAMFTDCINLLTLDVSSFDTRNVTNMNNMFSTVYDGGMKLEEIILGDNFNTSRVTDMENMFANLINIKTIDVSMFDTSNVTNMLTMFVNDYELENIIGLENFDTSNVINMESMFWACHKLTEINLCSFNTKSATNMKGMFAGTHSLRNIYVGPNWSTSQADTTNMFNESAISSVTTGQC